VTRLALVGALAALAVGGWAAPAKAAPWCGAVAPADRPQAVAGPFVHVVYAIPADGEDRSAAFAPQIADDTAQIEAWWLTQDSTRTPRFDVTPFSCGLQADVTAIRLPLGGAQLAPVASRYQQVALGVSGAGVGSSFGKYLVYYDGPVEEPDICGQAGGRQDSGPDYAVIYVTACAGIPTVDVAAHEFLHSLSALPAGAPHACGFSPGHPCDSTVDILYPYTSGQPLSELILDVGRDDYYGHAGAWFDVQDSSWLKHVGDQAVLSTAITGPGSVETFQPGPACAATCAVEWDRGSVVQLGAIPGPGQRLVRWGGACAGSGSCSVKLDAAVSVTALFAQARFRLSLSVGGKGIVRSAPAGLTCRVRCSAAFTSFQAVRLHAAANKGWRFKRWSGACATTKLTCSVPMTKAASVRASFVRRAA